MDVELLDHAIELMEKANADLEPELLTGRDARSLLDRYARVEKLSAFGKLVLAAKVGNAAEVARVAGTSMGKAHESVATGKTLSTSADLHIALQHGQISADQATEIARAEDAYPGASEGLLRTAQEQPFSVLKEKARAVKLEAEQHRDLGARQRAARSGRSHSDALGMVHIHLALEPHVGAPIVARAEAEAARLARAAKKNGRLEPFERHAADAYAKALTEPGSMKGPARRPELVVLVSHEVIKRGWKDVKDGEVCKIPGVGPVSPKVAKEIAGDAFLNGVFYDGRDLRHFVRYTKHIPVEVTVALELGEPPDFDGVTCVDCGNRFRTEFDHVEPRVARGPTSNGNLRPRCWSCHQVKTKDDRKNGKLKPPEP